MNAQVKGLRPLRVITKVAVGKLLGSIIAQQLPRRGETLNCAFISSAQEKHSCASEYKLSFRRGFKINLRWRL